MYRLDDKPPKQYCVSVLRQALELNPDNQYLKVLLGLKLQKIHREAEGEPLIEEALEKAPGQTDVLRTAARFYQRRGDQDKAIELFQKALKSLPNDPHIYRQLAFCYRAKAKQIQGAEDPEAGGNREKMEELRKSAEAYSNKAIARGLDPMYVFSDFTDLDAEECYQTAFTKVERKHLPQGYSNFQEQNGQSEDTPAPHHLSTKSTANGAERQLPRNSWYLQGLTHKLNGELPQAVECFEKELGHLLRNSPSGISSLLLPAEELAEGGEEVGQGADSSTPSKLSDPLADTEE